ALRGGGQGREIGEAPHPLAVIGDHSRDLGLLEHELRNQNCVRIARPAPRQFAAVAHKPAEKFSSKKSGIWSRLRAFSALRHAFENDARNREMPTPRAR